ncbi:DMT family transporter [Dehalobacterium formicoaceticum]|uniref:DMT family transporter n=1 Tax=Dehalobacterium formicoaceticum TaxID=51515 RepID=A0ABT1Y460_9FIRM|nr:DMT family transporter [Dehalobacterium formicoaceticum]MCR6545667.1 DMT family transporter [Dehalobacterium formicoaceticum]
MSRLEQARAKYRENMVRWGFIWALWTAVLWGAWYVPGTAIWYEAPFVNMASGTTGEYLTAAAVITALNAISVLVFMFLWIGVLGKWADYGRTIRKMRHISKWYFLAAIFGGPMAIFGSFMAMGYIGGVFAAVAGLMYPIIGSFLAYKWYGEKITRRAVVGIMMIIAGGLVVFAPGIIKELQESSGAWLGYLGGLMAALGWGFEGAIAGRALDVTDPDVGLTIRFTAEVFWWVAILLPFAAIFLKAPVLTVVAETLTLWPIILLLLAGMTFGFCYVSWYKAFPLIGVGRGQAIGDLYGVCAIIFLTIFTLVMPDWKFILGAVIVILGGFVMFTEKRDVLEVIRTVPTKDNITPMGGE